MLSLLLVFSVFIVFVLKAYLPVCVSVCLAHPSETLSEIRSHVSSLEEELSVKDSMLKATQGELVQCKKELTAKELNLQKTHARIAQESERVQTHTTIATNVYLPILSYICLKSCSFCHKKVVGLGCQNISLTSFGLSVCSVR